MGLSEEELIQHCNLIRDWQIHTNKIVILCEGLIDNSQRCSPQQYSRTQLQDAAFYKACIPRWWKKPKPGFFNCGDHEVALRDRQDVLNTYFTLLDSSNFQSPNKLFAIIDLDLQSKKIDDYPFPDTEAIFKDLYQGRDINEDNASNHYIWVTGLIHKEAYFFLPQLQSLFDEQLTEPTYNNQSLNLEEIYLAMCDGLSESRDLEQNFARVSQRVNYCSNLDCTGINQFQSSWRIQFHNSQDRDKEELIVALLRLAKAKQYWKEIKPPEEWTMPSHRYRDQLVLDIGYFYARQTDSKYHLPSLFTSIHERTYGKDNV